MLRLVNITKNYGSGESEVHALKQVSVAFRKNEFVSILGHSGCGKTTLLNIIGGLDHYTDGDLIINGKSTKEYKDRDWDNYRNHSIGFVFQSYNLIPHQTVLGNVELALTLSGVKRQERKMMAQAALLKVGLADQIHKLPNQLSGGQMQRVAIARALVNNPDIILADEPTGALDTDTSVQIMELLKEVAQDKLVIMVTHNPELAEAYSTRLVRLKDGEVISDSMPYDHEEEEYAELSQTMPTQEGAASVADAADASASDDSNGAVKGEKKVGVSSKTEKKPSMSLWTAFSLSIRNLFTKKGRTFLTAFAGSIGIIGIALILSMSNGFQAYINRLEQDTLSGYPLTIYKSTTDQSSLTELLDLFMQTDSKDDTAYPSEKKIISNDLAAKVLLKRNQSQITNDLKSFKTWLAGKESELGKLTNDVKYYYDLNFRIYQPPTESDPYVDQLYPFAVAEGSDLEWAESLVGIMNSTVSIWEELVDNQASLDQQYDVIAGSWPKTYDEKTDKEVFEVVLSVDKYNRIYDYLLCATGFIELGEIISNAILMNQEEVDYEARTYDFDEIIGKEYKLLLGAEDYQYDEENKAWKSTVRDRQILNERLNKAITIKVSGIIRPKEGLSSGMMEGAIGYRSDLTKYVLNKTNQLEIVKQQKANKTVNILTGKEFTEMDSYAGALRNLGSADLDDPSAIKFYVKGFDEKDKLVALIDEYNASVASDSEGDNKQIRYNDTVAALMSSVNTIINTISYVLIAFVSVSLIVSSIMIGIITYISVLERTKEIGVLRSIGASKRDITRLFNAETISVGFIAGMIGILVTLILNIPINLIIKHFTGIQSIAVLPWYGGVGLIAISMFLSFIAGFIPSKIAAKKDPVVALRTE